MCGVAPAANAPAEIEAPPSPSVMSGNEDAATAAGLPPEFSHALADFTERAERPPVSAQPATTRMSESPKSRSPSMAPKSAETESSPSLASKSSPSFASKSSPSFPPKSSASKSIAPKSSPSMAPKSVAPKSSSIARAPWRRESRRSRRQPPWSLGRPRRSRRLRLRARPRPSRYRRTRCLTSQAGR